MKILAALLLIGIFAGLGVLSAVCICARRKYLPQRSDCIIVLGALVWPDGRMSNSLRYRCESALAAWKTGLAPVIILSGGKTGEEPVAEAHAMRTWFIENGVPEGALCVEDASPDTRANLANARKIMEARGFETAIICTSDYHMTRALWLAKDTKISATGIAARSPSTLRSFIFGRCREAVGWVMYFFRLV